jgi:hypothetical protein
VRPGIDILLAQRIFARLVPDVLRGAGTLEIVDHSADQADIIKAARASLDAAELWQREYNAWESERRDANAKEGRPPKPPPVGLSEPGHMFEPGAGTHQCIVCGLDQSRHVTRPLDKNPGRGTEFSWQRGKRHGE